MTYGLHVFLALEPKFTLVKFVLCVIWPSELANEECVRKFCIVRQPEKVGTVSTSSDTGTTYVTLVKVPCCQLTYIPYVFKHCDLLVLKIIISWEAVCITLYSQNPNTTFKIRFWVFTHGFWRLVSWYFEPSQPQRITSWLKTMFSLSPIYSARKSSNHKLSINHKISPNTNLRADSSEYRVIPCKLMKGGEGWKYPLKHQEGGEG